MSGAITQTNGVRPGSMMILGASIEQNEGGDWPYSGISRGDNPSYPGSGSQPTTIYGGGGAINWSKWLNGGALRILKNLGQSGVPSNTQIANYLSSVSSFYAMGLNPAPGMIWMGHLTGDDPGNLTTNQSVANELQMFNALRARYPQSLIVLPTLPGVAVGSSPGWNFALKQAVNAQRRDWELKYNNVRVFDYESIYCDPLTGLPLTTHSQDNIHPNAVGGYNVGKALGTLLSPWFPAKSMVNDYTNDTRVLAANGGIGTDAMMKGTPGAGVLATGWARGSGQAASSVVNLVARGDQYGNWQELAYGGTAGKISISHAFGVALPAGAVVQAEAEIQFQGSMGAANLTDITFGFALGNASFATIGTSYAVGNTLNNRGPYPDPGSGVVITVRTPPTTVPTGMTLGASGMIFQVQSTGTAGAIRLGRASVLRLS